MSKSVLLTLKVSVPKDNDIPVEMLMTNLQKMATALGGKIELVYVKGGDVAHGEDPR